MSILSLAAKDNRKFLERFISQYCSEDPGQFLFLPINVGAWYKGITGMSSKDKEPKGLKTLTKAILAIGKPPVIGTTVYRMANVKVPPSGIETLMGRPRKLQVGPRPILSFSRDREYTKKFYKKFYTRGGGTPIKRGDARFAYVVLMTEVSIKNYVLDTHTITELFKLILTNWEFTLSLVEQLDPNEWQKLRKQITKYPFTATYKEISTVFIQQQQEVILRSKTSTFPNVEVVDVLWHSGNKD
jgi:hypothetical protein